MRLIRSTVGWTLMMGILGLMTTPAVRAGGLKPDTANWDNLKAVTPGVKVQIVLNSKKSYLGEFRNASDAAMVVRLEAGDQNFSREEVLRVSTKGKSHRLRNSLIGFGVGAGVGLGVGAAADHACKSCILPSLGKEALTPVGAIAGAVVGVALPTGRWQDVYRAR